MPGTGDDVDSNLLCDPAQEEELENANAADQIDYMTYLVDELGVSEARESHVIELQRLAIDRLYPCAVVTGTR